MAHFDQGGILLRVLWNNTASLSSVADAIPFCMILIMVCTLQLCGGDVAEAFFGQLLREKVPPTRLRAWASDKYEA
jgi:hypothetical protein